MHKSHQARLTGFSNQLNEQHAHQMNTLKEDYENQLSTLQETLKSLQEPAAISNLEEEKATLLSRIEELEQLSSESSALHDNELAELKAQSTAHLEELVSQHQEQIDQVSNELRVNKKCSKEKKDVEVKFLLVRLK